jgi:hypothetical protein
MNKKTIKKTISSKMEEWLLSITDTTLRNDVKNNLLVSGGSIASLFLNEKVNDYDVYIQDQNVLYRLAKYYYNGEIINGSDTNRIKNELKEAVGWREIAIRNIKNDQVKLICGGAGDKFEATNNPYHLLFASPNALSLSDDVQIVCRFSGSPDEIHRTFDFIHATNYFTFKDGLVTNLRAMESLLTKQLYYQGSMYPLTSIIRTKKFIKRGWNIGAGEYLKMMFQISQLNLTDPDVLDEQLLGVDIAHFATIIEILRGNNKSKITTEYLSSIIDKVFNETETN